MSNPISRCRSESNLDISAEIGNPRFSASKKRPQKISTLYMLVREVQRPESEGSRSNSARMPSSTSSRSSPSLESIVNCHCPVFALRAPSRPKIGKPFRCALAGAQPRSADIRSGSSSSPKRRSVIGRTRWRLALSAHRVDKRHSSFIA